MLGQLLIDPHSGGTAADPPEGLGGQGCIFRTGVQLRLFTIRNAGLQQQHLIAVTCQKGQGLEGLRQVVEHSVAEDDLETLPEILGRVIQVQEADRSLRVTLPQMGQIVRSSFGNDYFAIPIQEKGGEVANAGSDFENTSVFQRQM